MRAVLCAASLQVICHYSLGLNQMTGPSMRHWNMYLSVLQLWDRDYNSYEEENILTFLNECVFHPSLL